jgi:hypothetical protein
MQILAEHFYGGFAAEGFFALLVGVGQIRKLNSYTPSLTPALSPRRGGSNDYRSDLRRGLEQEPVAGGLGGPGVAAGGAEHALFVDAQGAGDVAGAEEVRG